MIQSVDLGSDTLLSLSYIEKSGFLVRGIVVLVFLRYQSLKSGRLGRNTMAASSQMIHTSLLNQFHH
jgi:hypothetical protein